MSLTARPVGLRQSPPPPCGQLGLLLEVELKSVTQRLRPLPIQSLHSLLPPSWHLMVSMQSSRPSPGFKGLRSSEFHRMLEGPGCSGCDSNAGTVRKMWLAVMLVELDCLPPETLCSRRTYKRTDQKPLSSPFLLLWRWKQKAIWRQYRLENRSTIPPSVCRTLLSGALGSY